MSPYAYTNARIRAWKSDLLDKPFFEKMLNAKDSEAVMAMLGQTLYQSDIEKGVIKFTGVSGVEEGLRQNLTNNLSKLLKIASNDVETDRLVKLVLTKWDIYNLKTVLRGFHAKASEEEIFEQLMPVGTFDEAALRSLVKQPNLKTAISQLIISSSQYASVLILGYKQYEKTNNLSELELGLDKSYFKSILEESSLGGENAQIVHDSMRREVDFVNLMTLFRLNKEALPDGVNIKNYFINGGFIRNHKLIELSKIKDLKSLIEALSRTPYYDQLKEGYHNYQKSGALSSIERSLEDYNIHKNVALFRSDPLSVATIVAYVTAKINEIINIRIILRGKDVHMPAEDMKEALVFV